VLELIRKCFGKIKPLSTFAHCFGGGVFDVSCGAAVLDLIF
jgi:hypothetical protein